MDREPIGFQTDPESSSILPGPGRSSGRAGWPPAAQGRGPALPLLRPHEQRPGHRRQFDHRDRSRMACTTPADEAVDLYLHGQAWRYWLRVVYVLSRGTDLASSASTAPASQLSLPSATPSNTWAPTTVGPPRRPGCTFISTWSLPPGRTRAETPPKSGVGPQTPPPTGLAT